MRAWAVVENEKPLQEIELATPEPNSGRVADSCLVLLLPTLPITKRRKSKSRNPLITFVPLRTFRVVAFRPFVMGVWEAR